MGPRSRHTAQAQFCLLEKVQINRRTTEKNLVKMLEGRKVSISTAKLGNYQHNLKG